MKQKISSESRCLCVGEDSVCFYVRVEKGHQLVPICVSRLSGGECVEVDMTSSQQAVHKQHLQTAHQGGESSQTGERGRCGSQLCQNAFLRTGFALDAHIQ